MSVQTWKFGLGRRLLAGSALAAALAALQAPAIAQDPAAGTAAAADSDEEVIVTAQKRSERLIDVPISISSVSEKQMRSQNLVTLSELGGRLPNVLAANSSLFPNFTIRGISSQSGGSPGFAPAVGVYVDEVFQGRDRAYNVPLEGIARVEVLRGPQGTLYGKNTIGGTISIITEKPTNDFHGSASAQYGNLGFNQETLTLSGPIVENRFLLLGSFIRKERDGYIYNRFRGEDINGYEGYGGRLRAIITPTDTVTFDLSADYYTQDGTEALQTVTYVPLPFPPYNTLPKPDPDNRIVDLDAPITGEREVWGASARFDIELDWATLTGIVAHREYTSAFQDDSDGLPLDEFSVGRAEDAKINSQELRLTSNGNGAFSWIAGAYFYQEDLDSVNNINLGPRFPSALFGLPPLPATFRERALTTVAVDESSWAGFGSFTYDFDDQLRLAGGIRFTHESKDLFYSQLPTVFVNGLIAAFALPISPRTDSLSEGEWTGDISLTYKITPENVVYAKFSRGYKAGGFQADVISPPPNTPPVSFKFEPEFVNNYEAGYKARWFDGMVSMNAAVFYLDYTNKQERVNTGVSYVISNAGEARVYGAELELDANLFEGFHLTGSLGLLDAKYTSFKNAGGLGINFDGNRLTGAPRATWTVAAQYDFPIAGEFNGTVRAEAQHLNEIYTDSANSQDLLQRDYTLLNARAGVEGENWGFYLWGKNLGDELVLSGGTKVITVTARGINAGRTYGAELRLRF